MSCRKLKVPVLTTLKGTYMLVLSREVFFCHAVHEGSWSSTLENVPSEADCRAQEPLILCSLFKLKSFFSTACLGLKRLSALCKLIFPAKAVTGRTPQTPVFHQTPLDGSKGKVVGEK